MKTMKKLFGLLLMLGVGWGLTGCDSDEIKLGNISNSLCKPIDIGSRLVPYECMEVAYEVKDNLLKVTMINYPMNCGAEGASMELVSCEGNKIVLKPYDIEKDGIVATCTCAVDVTAAVRNLVVGETYHCTVSIYDDLNFSFTFVLENGRTGTIKYSDGVTNLD